MGNPITLTVHATENGARFDRLESAPLSGFEEIRIDTVLINRINDEIQKLTERTRKPPLASGDLTEELKQLGQILFEQFLPQNIKDFLKSEKKGDIVLRLEELFLEIPWEIAFDGRHFIGSKFRIGRNILRTSSVKAFPASSSIRNTEKIDILIISDPTETLPGAQEEAEYLCSFLDSHPDKFNAEIIGGREADKLLILDQIKYFDVVHFAGHSISPSEHLTENGWKLWNGFLKPEEIGNLEHPPKLIFSNSCASASVSASQIHRGNLGLGGNFLTAGVSHYIGTLWVIHDVSSARFAKDFYASLFTGASVGEALHHARHQSMTDLPEHDFIWASYVHYGDPRDRLFPSSLREVTKAASAPPSGILLRPAAAGAAAMFVLLLALGYWLRPAPPPNEKDDFLSGLYAQAVLDYKAGRTEPAYAAFRLLVTRKDNPKGLGSAYLSQIYLEAGDQEKAERYLDISLRKNPNGIMGHILSGDRAWRKGQAQEAAKAYLFALEDPKASDWQKAGANNSLGSAAFLIGQTEKAETYFLKAASQDIADAASNLGVLEYFRSNDEKALEWFEKTLEASPDDEIASLFVKLIPMDEVSRNTSSKRMAIGPFILSGGSVRRIGADVLLREFISRTLRSRNPDWQCHTPQIFGPDYLDYRFSRLSGLRKLTDFLHSQNFRLALFGELSMTDHVFAVHLKMTNLETGKIFLDKKFYAEANRKIERIIIDIERTLNSSRFEIK